MAAFLGLLGLCGSCEPSASTIASDIISPGSDRGDELMRVPPAQQQRPPLESPQPSHRQSPIPLGGYRSTRPANRYFYPPEMPALPVIGSLRSELRRRQCAPSLHSGGGPSITWKRDPQRAVWVDLSLVREAGALSCPRDHSVRTAGTLLPRDHTDEELCAAARIRSRCARFSSAQRSAPSSRW